MVYRALAHGFGIVEAEIGKREEIGVIVEAEQIGTVIFQRVVVGRERFLRLPFFVQDIAEQGKIVGGSFWVFRLVHVWLAAPQRRNGFLVFVKAVLCYGFKIIESRFGGVIFLPVAAHFKGRFLIILAPRHT